MQWINNFVVLVVVSDLINERQEPDGLFSFKPLWIISPSFYPKLKVLLSLNMRDKLLFMYLISFACTKSKPRQ